MHNIGFKFSLVVVTSSVMPDICDLNPPPPLALSIYKKKMPNMFCVYILLVNDLD